MAKKLQTATSTDEKQKSIRMLPLERIRLDLVQPKAIDPNNPVHIESLNRLIVDIQERGMLYPILVTPFRVTGDGASKRILFGQEAEEERDSVEYWVLDGHKRVTAYRQLEKESIPAIVKVNELNFQAVMEIQFVTGGRTISLDTYNGLEIARAIKRFVDNYVSDRASDENATTIGEALQRLSNITGFSRSFFDSRLEILQLPEDLQESVRVGKTKNNFASELRNVAKTDEERNLIIDAAKKQEIISLLDQRVIGKKFREIDELEDTTPSQKFKLKETVVRLSGREPTEMLDAKPDFDGYQLQVKLWYRQMSKWKIVGMNDRQLAELAGEVHNLYELFLNMQKTALGKGDLRGQSWRHARK